MNIIRLITITNIMEILSQNLSVYFCTPICVTFIIPIRTKISIINIKFVILFSNTNSFSIKNMVLTTGLPEKKEYFFNFLEKVASFFLFTLPIFIELEPVRRSDEQRKGASR